MSRRGRPGDAVAECGSPSGGRVLSRSGWLPDMRGLRVDAEHDADTDSAATVAAGCGRFRSGCARMEGSDLRRCPASLHPATSRPLDCKRAAIESQAQSGVEEHMERISLPQALVIAAQNLIRSMTRAGTVTALATVICWTAAAQTNPAPAAPAGDQEAKIRELEDRIIALENIVKQLKASQMAPAPVAGAATTTAQTTAPTQAQAVAPAVPAPSEQAGAPVAAVEQVPTVQTGGATSMAKALNPDISAIGDFVGAFGRSPVTGAPVPALEMHESELGFQAIIDPYARGDFFLSFGEEGVNLEEGYITFTALPGGIVARVGKMRSAFGKVNTLHNHVLPWIDRPLVTDNLVGGEDGIDDAGLSVTRAFAGPKGLFLEGTGQVFRGDSADLFKSSQRDDVSVVGHFRGHKDITESTNIDLGGSYARGHTDLGSKFLTTLYGSDGTVRWTRLRRSISHSFVGRSELIWSKREEPTGIHRAFGMYASGDYQFGRRWFIGARTGS